MAASNYTSCIAALEENSQEVYLETTALLLKVADNVLRNPTKQQYRSIRLSNPTVASKILPAIGAMECLFSMGFEEVCKLVCPKLEVECISYPSSI